MGQLPRLPRRAHSARPRHVHFDKSSHKLIIVAVEKNGRLKMEDIEFVGQQAASLR